MLLRRPKMIPKLGGVFLFLLLLSTGLLFAQVDRATVTGIVTDETGALLPGSAVLATQIDTGATFTGVANASGVYNLTALPIGNYQIKVSHDGFKDSVATVYLIAAQVQQLNVKMTVGSTSQTVTVSSAPPLLESQTTNVGMTLESEAVEDLPLNATNGRDAMTLLTNTAPTMSASSITGNQVYSTFIFAGGLGWTNTAYIDGVDAGAGPQGAIATPGMDALQEVQVQTSNENAELGMTGSGVLLFELKSGTNKFHGSGFEFLQNEDLNANTWSNNYFLSNCATNSNPTQCRSVYRRPRDRFNDFGGSAGGPIWKNHTFVFGDYEYYTQSNDTLNVNALTVPTARMLTGDFGELLTGGTNSGPIINSSTGQPYINPCTGLAYQYGEIYDPRTWKTVNGVTCATPFAGNVIPSGLISSQAKVIAGLYSKYYVPTISRIYDNYPSINSNTPSIWKRSMDFKVDHSFSSDHHISASYDYVKWSSVTGGGLVANQGLSTRDPGPLSSEWSNNTPNFIARIVDNYSFTPNVLNTIGLGYSSTQYIQMPTATISNAGQYGFNADASSFPTISYGGSNGVGEQGNSTGVSNYQNYYGYHFQDTLAWQRKNHSFKFGGELYFQGLNTETGGNIENFTFAANTGGPTDSSITPWVGSGFASMMMGNVQSASKNIPYAVYPRQKYLTLFGQDDIKVNNKLTANIGMTWDFTFAGHAQNGHWTNFDVAQQNPNWAPYMGAWTFAQNSGDTFQVNNTFRQFGPHVGLAYQITPKLLGRVSYGLFYVPLGEMNSGAGYNFPSQQAEFWQGTNTVVNSIPGATAFNWDNGYPGQTVTLARTIDQTSQGYDYALYINPDTLKLGYTSDYYIGVQYEMAKNLLWDIRYVGTRGNDLHDTPESIGMNYPSLSTYVPLLVSGKINSMVSSASDAAALGVPYPYAGFSGPAYAAIAPFPQFAYNGSLVKEADIRMGVSAYDAAIFELKSMNFHGLNADLSLTISHLTGSNLSNRDSAYNGNYGYQSADDIQASRNWVQASDTKGIGEGYVTYQLPVGRGRHWLSTSSRLDYLVGGWTIGAFGSYASASPMGAVTSTVQWPFFFSSQRANFTNGATPFNMKNHFHGKVNLSNTASTSNRDFNPNLFATPTLGTLGNSPFKYNNWRWNSGVAHENASLNKAFTFGGERKYEASLRAEFYNVFNRHYLGSPETNMTSANFGNVTSVSGNRSAQVAARFRW